MKRVLAVDWGERRLGLALSDPLGITAQPIEPIVLSAAATRLPAGSAAAIEPALRALSDLAREHDVGRIVVGLPLLLSGEKGEAARAAEAFAEALGKRVAVPVELWDERLTSVLAEQSLREEGAATGRRRGGGRERTRARPADKARVDRRAALLLLQSWLDAHRGGAA